MRAISLPSLSNGRRVLAVPAGTLIAIYAALILLAATCPVDPAPVQSGHHHHSSSHHDKAAHTLLCVWACQISSTTALIAVQQILHPTPFLITVILFSSLVGCSTTSDLLRTRAPPCRSLF